MRHLRSFRQADRGFTLIELMVYSALLVLVLGIVGSIMVSGITNQARITQTSEAASAGAVAAQSVGSGVRNAIALNVPTVSTPLLVAKTVARDANGTVLCQAWYYSAAEHAIRTTTTNPGTRIGVPTAAQLAGWTLLVKDVAPASTGTAVFTVSGASVDLAFSVAPKRGIAQIVHTSFTSRQPAVGGSPSECVA